MSFHYINNNNVNFMSIDLSISCGTRRKRTNESEFVYEDTECLNE